MPSFPPPAQGERWDFIVLQQPGGNSSSPTRKERWGHRRVPRTLHPAQQGSTALGRVCHRTPQSPGLSPDPAAGGTHRPLSKSCPAPR